MRYVTRRSLAIVFISSFFCSPSHSSDVLQMTPPKINLVDEHGINMINGQVQSTLETVSIGGSMGLSHSISNHTNNFLPAGYRGYEDKFLISSDLAALDTRPLTYQNVLRVRDFTGSADFKLVVNGVVQNFTSNPVTTSYTYRALGDTRHTLETRSDGVYWTKPDGTVVVFKKPDSRYPGSVGSPTQVIYPNGFTTYIDYTNKRVWTNTGYALKYIYEYDSSDAELEASKRSIKYDNVNPPVNPQYWATVNPKYIQAINTSIESCQSSDAVCTNVWPKAEFDWPAGMPRAIFLGDSTFKVKDAMGGVTEYYFRSFDLAYNGTTLAQGYTPYKRFSPRLIGIKPAHSKERVYQYQYKNLFQTQSDTNSTWHILSQEAGEITGATRYNDQASYTIGEAYYTDIQNMSSGYIQRVLPKYDLFPGAMNKVETREGTMQYEQSYRNFPFKYAGYNGVVETFEYDTRGNMNSHTRGAVTVTAGYLTSCDANNFRYCNSPTWTRDGKGKQTDYAYHAQSGQVSIITYPANKNGLRPETRYTYEPKYANYYNLSGVKTQASTPVWLKTEEKYCINSNAFNGVCAGNDEVITRYEYQHDNLHLTGMTVTDNTGKTLRTCYQYDIYGNRIGETQPNANLTSCN